ncbi:MAG: hypothetical protein HY350_03595 [Candidatus Omnitrophica bacterium]|nr:hypothetical protein [Candidatus Omnitrophota bacterium]
MMGKFRIMVSLLFIGSLLSIRCFCDVPDDLSVKLDGKLDDPIWQKAKRYEPFRFSGKDEPATVQSTGMFACDDKYFYFGFICQEPEIARIQQNAKENDLKMIYGDDSVEIMIDSNRGGKDGFHRIISNSTGYTGTFFFWKYGSYMPLKVLSYSGGNVEENRWTVEIAVPIAALARNGGLSKEIGVNFGRNRVAGQKREETYTSPKGNFFYPGTFHVIPIDEINRDPYLVNIKPLNGCIIPKMAKIIKKGEMLEGIVSFVLKNEGSKPKNLFVTAILSDSNNVLISGKDIKKNLSLTPGEEKQVDLPVSVPSAGEYNISLQVNENSRVVADLVYPLYVKFNLIVLNISKPFYRNNIYATEKIEEIKAKVTIGLPSQEIQNTGIILSFQNDKKETITSRKFDIMEIDNILSLTIPDLKEGKYVLKVSLEKDNKTLLETEQVINKLLPAKGNEVRIDENLQLLLNGKTFFPIVSWNGPPIESVKSSEMNAILSPVAMFDKAKELGLLSVFYFSTMPYKEYRNVKNIVLPIPENSKKIFIDTVNQIKDHPAFLYYYLIDEPGLFGVNHEFVKEAYELVRDLDPYHPILICDAIPSAPYTFYDSCDIFAPDANPLPLKDKGLCRTMTTVPDFIEELKKAGDGKQMAGFTCQVFNYGDMGVPICRIQSFVEQRCMNYLAIIAGSRMLQYAMFANAWDKYPSVKIGLPYLSKELDVLAPAILNGKEASNINSSNPDIRLLAREKDNQLYIIAVNTTGKMVESNFSLPGETKELKVVSEKREIKVKANSFLDKFIPFGAHIYTTDSSLPDLKTLEEIKKEITDAGGFYGFEKNIS